MNWPAGLPGERAPPDKQSMAPMYIQAGAVPNAVMLCWLHRWLVTRGEFGADEFVHNASVHLPPEKVRIGWLLLLIAVASVPVSCTSVHVLYCNTNLGVLCMKATRCMQHVGCCSGQQRSWRHVCDGLHACNGRTLAQSWSCCDLGGQQVFPCLDHGC